MKDLSKISLPAPPTEEESRKVFVERMARDQRDPNCISFWYPLIRDAVPTPKTEIVQMHLTYEMGSELWSILDGKEPPKWLYGWSELLRTASRKISADGPWFLRSGVFSGKHDWRRCCAVTDLDKLVNHVINIFEFSQIVDAFGLAYNVWAIREWLHGPHLLEYEPFNGMPIRREFRVFAEAGEIKCLHPYWPEEALDPNVTKTDSFKRMNSIDDHDQRLISELVAAASRCVDGEWSIDVLKTLDGWYVTDMALAARSYHWPTCCRIQE